MTQPYLSYLTRFAALADEARSLPLGGFPPADAPALPDDAPVALLFAPHPDDECIVGALPLRLRRQGGCRIVVVAVTQGSLEGRREARLEEMEGACRFLGFELATTRPGGLTGINPEGRRTDPGAWAAAVGRVGEILSRQRPALVFVPHAEDWNLTHMGTHLLVADALASLGPAFRCRVAETEFWRAMADPGLMVESALADVADLVAALSFHKGEVARNPYHLTLPSWMADNVRRGGEVVGGQGGAAPPFRFATLYRLRDWNGREMAPCPGPAPFLPADASPGWLLDR
jgi:LmbE family N-acetylglucosaminyl deacetylase